MLRFTGVRFAEENQKMHNFFFFQSSVYSYIAQVIQGFYRERFLIKGRDLFSVNHGPKSNHSIQSLLNFGLIPGEEMFRKAF